LLLAMLISSTSLAAGAPPARCDHPFHGKTIVLRGNYCPPNVIGGCMLWPPLHHKCVIMLRPGASRLVLHHERAHCNCGPWH